MFKPGDYVVYHGRPDQPKHLQAKWFGVLFRVKRVNTDSLYVEVVSKRSNITFDDYQIVGLDKFTLVNDYEPV